jgi:hypothetical protein
MFLSFGQTQQLHTMLQSVVYHSSTASPMRDHTNVRLHRTRNNSLITVKNLVSKPLKVGGFVPNHLFIVVQGLLSLTLLLVRKLITVSVHHKVLMFGLKVK